MSEPYPTDPQADEPQSAALSGAATDQSSEGTSDTDTMHNVRELADLPSIEVISKAAVMLMSSAADKLGLSEDDPDTAATRDLDEARRLITALAGLITASVEYLGPHAGAMRDGLQTLQRAFREASVEPDPPGQGPGEKYTGPVH